MEDEATGASLTAEEVEVGHPMLDPTWTPQRGYAHALDLLLIAERAARMKEGKA